MWRQGRAYRARSEGPILILQMGKVGSKSVQAGVEARCPDRAIYHAHFLSRQRTARTEAKRKKFFRTERHSYLARPWQNQFLRHTFNNADDNRQWKLITLTREPVGRNISAFFENLDVKACQNEGEFEIRSDYYDIEPTIVSVENPHKLAELFFERAQHDSPLQFFDREIKDIFGVDVLSAGFPIEKGYNIYKAERVELLVLKLESLAQCASAAFREFLGIDDFKVIDRNVGAKKIYAPLYDAFKQHAVIDSGYADRLYDSDYMRTFYSSEEIQAAREKWLRKSDSGSA
jgi:Putative capsular polysaccharide synthesis protein